ncbi:protein ELYS isoform X2 [Anthonomus grandis grandis]|nr:protein ELYS isoform X2 [Anthonomus grandis grandis]
MWHAKGPCLEVRNITPGHKVGCWTFGKLLKDNGVTIAGVQELRRNRGNLSLQVVAVNSPLTGGQICIFDPYGSKVLRVIQLGEQITSIYVVDHGCETSSLPELSPLKYFDGILAVGTVGATVFLMDLCKQIAEEAIHKWDSKNRNELNPCPVVILKKEKLGDIKKYIEKYVDSHLALCLNESLDSQKEYFSLKGEEGDDRVCVNRIEAEVSALLYSQQLGSLLIGYNFGAFQLWDLSLIEICYTSPICDGNIPVTHFTVQEPADDPKSYCYVWVAYSHSFFLQPGLPYAVMYSFLYSNKRYLNGFGNVYENFQHCTLRFQIELGGTEGSSLDSKVKGGLCLGLQSVTKHPLNKDLSTMALCLVSWLFWNAEGEANTAVLLFDLNQWYKEQMPRVPNWLHCSNYMIRQSVKEVILDVKMDPRTLIQFMGIQRCEEHFCPTALSFDLWGITEDSVLKIHNKGVQKNFLDQLAHDGHLALIKPDVYMNHVVDLGLVPLFCDLTLNNSSDIAFQREILLNVALEHRLLFWLCDCTTKLANGSFNAAALNLFDVLHWAFQRAVHIKTCCDKYCVPLFDYSGMKLDDNTITMISCGIGQIRSLCSFYQHIIDKLGVHVDGETLLEEQRSLENVVVYFEVLLWMVNIGLLPECPPSPNITLITSAPYLVQNLTESYNNKRAQLKLACKETFVEQDCLLFIDNMINYRGCAEVLRQQWQEDGGSGLYPPPSLQSVLRTYLLDGADLDFKHSLVTYVLLDIAKTLDQDDKIIKLLLKFPQIFNLKLSKMKIVQAFWHLDHDDYETATHTILDSCVSPLDLQQWHHSVMMRSLLMQDHSSLALLYLDVRKPTLNDKKDLLTVLSLLISKKMLDEAFTFRQQYEGPSEHILLNHIFEECNKNGILHNLLHRQMDAEDEKVFFDYLQSTGNARCQDLQIFYYLQRARFLEAFDTYSSRKRKLPDSQGLIGQKEASAAENVLIMFKNLLPDVNRDLVEMVRKERQTLWKEVPRPTPLSVFVHNTHEKVRYKSSVIFASLSKAKQTFNDTLDETKTENTPFLRTPALAKTTPRIEKTLLKAKVIQQTEQGDIQDSQCGPSPCKKLKLSGRSSMLGLNDSLSVSNVRSGLFTPIVRRKRQSMEQVDVTTNWPHSILKSAGKPSVEDTKLEETMMNNVTGDVRSCVSKAMFELSPRKSLRTPFKGHVKFDVIRNSGGSLEEASLRGSMESQGMSKSSSMCGDDSVFYSPETSGGSEKHEGESKKSLVREQLDFSKDDSEVVKEESVSKGAETSHTDSLKNFQSPRARRSYKRSYEDSPTPVRSSPRLTKITSQNAPEIPPSTQMRGRRSLVRSVLEQNALSALNEEKRHVPLNISGFSSFSSVNSSLPDLDSSSDSSWQNLYNKCLAEIDGRTEEISVVTTRRESLKTGDLVTSKEIVQKLESKTVEIIDERSDEKVKETPEKEKEEEEEELVLYDDVSSGSEDVREVLKNLNKTNLGKTYADLTTKRETEENSTNDDSESEFNKAKVDFIEIESSSEEDKMETHSSSPSLQYDLSSEQNSQSYDSSTSKDCASLQASECNRNSPPIDEDESTQEVPKFDEEVPVHQDEDTREALKHPEQEPSPNQEENTQEIPQNPENVPSEILDSDDEYMDELVLHQDEELPEDILEDPLNSQSISVQCTSHPNSVMSEESTGAAVETRSIALQCTLAAQKSEEDLIDKQSEGSDNETLKTQSEEDDISPPRSPKVVATSPDKTIILRSVKKTYKGPKAKSDPDATPKVALDKIKRTYSRTRKTLEKAPNGDDNQNKSEETEEAETVTKPMRLRRTSRRLSEMEAEEKDIEEPQPGPSGRISTLRRSSSSKEIVETKAVSAVKPIRRTRSASVDQPPPRASLGKKRFTRSKSIDLDESVTGSSLKTPLPPIEEQPGTSTGNRPRSSLGEYTTSRRLTRKQASMLKTINQVEEETENLLEASDSVETGFERKKLRPRKQSFDSVSVTSEQSIDSTPPKRSKTDQEAESKPRGKRARSASISSVKSNTSVSSARSSTRSRRLAEIQEEKGSNEGQSSDSSAKKGKHKGKK